MELVLSSGADWPVYRHKDHENDETYQLDATIMIYYHK